MYVGSDASRFSSKKLDQILEFMMKQPMFDTVPTTNRAGIASAAVLLYLLLGISTVLYVVMTLILVFLLL